MYSLIKAVTILYEIIQFLSRIFNNVLVEFDAVVHTKRASGGKKKTTFFEINLNITWHSGTALCSMKNVDL